MRTKTASSGTCSGTSRCRAGADVQIGVTIADLEGDEAQKMSGAVVSNVREDSPAAKAGLVAGDIVIEFDGEKVRSARHLSRIVGETPAGRSVKMVVQREGRRVDLQVTPEAGMARGDHEFLFRRMPNPGSSSTCRASSSTDRTMRGFPEEHGLREGDDPGVMVMPPAGDGWVSASRTSRRSSGSSSGPTRASW